MFSTSRVTCFALLTIFGCDFSLAAHAVNLKPHSLAVGAGFVDPIGFHDPSPVFSWKLPVAEDVKAQSAYQIVVSESSGSEASVIWDSGKVESDQSVWVPFQEAALKSRQQVSWRVKFWDDQGRESDWSNEATIEMGLLNNSDWDALWVELDGGTRKPDVIKIVRAEFGNRTVAGSKVKDVTDILRGAMKRGATPFPVISRRLGGDPAPTEVNTLWVDFELNGTRKQVEIPENEKFSPFPPITRPTTCAANSMCPMRSSKLGCTRQRSVSMKFTSMAKGSATTCLRRDTRWFPSVLSP